MKILYVATVRSHVGQFHMPVIRQLIEDGHEVHAAFHDNSADKKGLDLSVIPQTFEIPFERSPYSLKNITAYKALKKVIREGHYDIIHCHTPVGAMLTRLAARKERKRGTKVFYTAHGFHFYKGASRKNWLLFYPVEKFLARYTDVLITINQEDYDLATSRHFRAGKIVKVEGVGVDLSKFHVSTEEEKQAMREAYGFAPDQFILLYAADLSFRFAEAADQGFLFFRCAVFSAGAAVRTFKFFAHVRLLLLYVRYPSGVSCAGISIYPSGVCVNEYFRNNYGKSPGMNIKTGIRYRCSGSRFSIVFR